jgi:predicted RNase H-like HicB family nuclease
MFTDPIAPLAETYFVVFEQAANGSWSAVVPDYPTHQMDGLTLAEAQANTKSDVEFWMELIGKVKQLPVV